MTERKYTFKVHYTTLHVSPYPSGTCEISARATNPADAMLEVLKINSFHDISAVNFVFIDSWELVSVL